MDTVLFICEHGSAKSVVAAAHFNKLAAERGLPFRAIARGTDPDEANHPAAVAGLEADELHPESEPRRLSSEDIVAAKRVISFGELPAEYSSEAPVTVWNVPPVTENYNIARSAIVGRINLVVDELLKD